MSGNTLTHLDAKGNAHMVDVGSKEITHREAIASGKVLLKPETIQILRDGKVPKGDAISAARIAGIMAAKRTSELIPLCHPLPISRVSVELEILDEGVSIVATVGVNSRTGVEMEALTAVSVASLTIYDMIKALDKSAVITDIRLEHKIGGKSGEYRRES